MQESQYHPNPDGPNVIGAMEVTEQKSTRYHIIRIFIVFLLELSFQMQYYNVQKTTYLRQDSPIGQVGQAMLDSKLLLG